MEVWGSTDCTFEGVAGWSCKRVSTCAVEGGWPMLPPSELVQRSEEETVGGGKQEKLTQ